LEKLNGYIDDNRFFPFVTFSGNERDGFTEKDEVVYYEILGESWKCIELEYRRYG